MGGYDYAAYSDHPKLIALCASCAQPDCDGICEIYKECWRALFGKPELMRRKRGTKPIGKYKKPLVAFGEAHCLAVWARIYDIPYHTLYQRIYSRGHSLEAALEMGNRSGQHYRDAVKYDFDGKSLSIGEWAKYTGICEETLRARIVRGWPLPDVFTRRPEHREA